MTFTAPLFGLAKISQQRIVQR